MALKRTAPNAAEPKGLWQAGRQSYSTADLLGILEAEPERISPSALLRPVFQDFLLSNFAGHRRPCGDCLLRAVLGTLRAHSRAGRRRPQPRFFGTLIEPAVAKLLERHELTLEQVFAEDAASLAQLLARASMPVETKQKAGRRGQRARHRADRAGGMDAIAGPGAGPVGRDRSGQDPLPDEPAAHASRELSVAEGSLPQPSCRDISQALFPGGVLQERVHGAAYYFARYGVELAETLCAQAGNGCAGHTAIWL